MSRYLWTQKEDFGPSARFGHAMTYDSARSQTILFGGDDIASGFLKDTWVWSGEHWTQVADIGPTSRRDHVLCFDSVRNTALLFGGLSGPTSPLGDTWSWNGEDWTQLEDSGPSARAGHAMVFDPARGRAVLFGGESAAGPLNDTWEWDGQEWTQQEDTGPSPRKHHALGYDLVRGRVVLFGGDPGTGLALGDTWSWDGSNWTQISTFGASPCLRAAMVSTETQIAMFGGLNRTVTPQTLFRETWVFDGEHWTHRQDIGPGPRWAHAMAYDSTRQRTVLFGGHGAGSGLLRDTWEHNDGDAAPATPPITFTDNPNVLDDRVTVVSIDLAQNDVDPGTQVQATIWLSVPAPRDTSIGWGWPDPTNRVPPLTPVPVTEGESSVQISFAAPSLGSLGGQITVLAVTNYQSDLSLDTTATLRIRPET